MTTTSTPADVRRPTTLGRLALVVGVVVLLAAVGVAVADLSSACSQWLALQPVRLVLLAGAVVGTAVAGWVLTRSGHGGGRVPAAVGTAAAALGLLVALALIYVPRFCVYDLIG